MVRLDLQEVLLMCNKHNIFSPSCSLYGGLPGVFDYGAVGAEIKLNLRKAWWESIVYGDFNVYGIEAALLTPIELHLHSGFIGANYDEFGVFQTTMKNEEGSSRPCHLRVTTAQHSFANFDNVVNAHGTSLPFGIAQIGKAFRHENDVTAFPVRMREFEQMEVQYFVNKEEASAWHEFWLGERLGWWGRQGVNLENIIVENVGADELAHYSSKTYDINYRLKDGAIFEIEGIANRGDFDCGSHSGYQDDFVIDTDVAVNNISTALMAIKPAGHDVATVPYVIEPAAGVDRGLMAILLDCYMIDRSCQNSPRVVLRIKPHLAPFKACLYVSHSADTTSISMATAMKGKIQKITRGKVEVKVGGDMESIFRNHDEVGTPIIVIIDGHSGGVDTVQVRDRDSARITNMPVEEVLNNIRSEYFD